MTNDIRSAHDILVQHAEDNENTGLQTALHKFAVTQGWEEKTAAEIANSIRH